MQFKWNYERPTPDRQQQAKELADKIGMSPVLAELLIQRGIKTESAAKRFFRPMLNELIDPFLMNDMDVAVDRLNDAMGRKERIMVYGDYDVDGCTAVALVYKFLQQFYSNTDYYIPNREEEGYGVSRKGIEYAAETGVKLIVVLDCGIKAVDEIAYAKTLGIDFIICDHHVPDEVMPPAVAILNPKRTDSTYPFKHLCGCGVGQAFAKNNGIPFSRLIPLLDFCAVSIAADLVPVEGENRTLAFHGLKQLNQSPCIGLKAIIEICGLGGRELTMSDIVARLESQRHMESIVLYDEGWKKGVVGIVASRLTELYFRPTVVLTIIDGIASGSARSVAGFDIYDAVKSCRDLLENFGGHTYAVGLTLRQENIPEFRRRFQEYVSNHILPEQTQQTLDIDKELDFHQINKRLLSELKRLAPHGPGNSKPLFLTRNVFDYGTSKVVGRHQEHIKLELVDSKSAVVMNGIAFGQSAAARYIKSKRSFDIVYTIEENSYKRGEVQLQIEDIRPSEDE